MHACYMCLHECDAAKTLLYHEDLLGLFVGCLCHDIDHPGWSNAFEINRDGNIAILYNDRSVLENHHAAYTFSILREQDKDIFATLPRDKQRSVRKTIIGGILATDMAHHFDLVTTLKKRIQDHHASMTKALPAELVSRTGPLAKASSGGDNDNLGPSGAQLSARSGGSISSQGALNTARRSTGGGGGGGVIVGGGGMRRPSRRGSSLVALGASGRRRSSSFFLEIATKKACPLSRENADDRMLLVKSLIHLSDLSNPVVPFHIFRKWADLIVIEYYNQHQKEEELGLPSLPFMAKHPDDLLSKATLEMNFIDFIVMPIWDVMAEIFDGLKGRVAQLQRNKDEWARIKAEEEKKDEGNPNAGDKEEAVQVEELEEDEEEGEVKGGVDEKVGEGEEEEAAVGGDGGGGGGGGGEGKQGGEGKEGGE